MKLISARPHYKITVLSLIAVSFLALQGCGSGKKGITIDSDPQGANVIADGKNIGTTPMHITQDEVFPAHWYGTSYMVKGKLEISKHGCEDFSMKVNDAVLLNDISASLKCRPDMKKSSAKATKKPADKTVKSAPAVSAVAPAQAESSKPVIAMDADIEQRLIKLKSLRDRGVITADEYSVQRRRILDTL